MLLPRLNSGGKFVDSGVTCIQLLHVFSCYMYSVVTCIQLLHVLSCYMYSVVTCIQLLHVFSCYMYSVVTCIQLLQSCFKYSCIHTKGSALRSSRWKWQDSNDPFQMQKEVVLC